MPREDETYRRVRYGGHPPACTCADCTRRRLSRGRGRGVARGVWISAVIIVAMLLFALLVFRSGLPW